MITSKKKKSYKRCKNHKIRKCTNSLNTSIQRQIGKHGSAPLSTHTQKKITFSRQSCPMALGSTLICSRTELGWLTRHHIAKARLTFAVFRHWHWCRRGGRWGPTANRYSRFDIRTTLSRTLCERRIASGR